MVSSMCTDVFLLIDGNRRWQTDWWWFLITKGHSCLTLWSQSKPNPVPISSLSIFLIPASSTQNTVFILYPLTRAFRYNVHANNNILAVANFLGSFYCHPHSVYASMRRMKRAMEWKSGSSEQRCLPANSPQRLLKPFWPGGLRTWD